MHMEHPTTLPNLPGMFFRSLFTVARKDDVAADAFQISDVFQAPGFTNERLQRYHEAFAGFSNEVPLTLMYCLAQRVHLAQMLGEQFPWPAPGLVHVSNALEQHQAVATNTDFIMKASIAIPARGPKVSPRRLRPLFTVEFWQDEQLVVTCTSEYQVMPKSSAKAPSRDKKAAEAPSEPWQALSEWQLNEASGRQYARLSGDFNPIHLHPLVSRWFGFEQPIIHGMYMAARAQAEIERAAGKAVRAIDVSFKRPVPLPARIRLWQQLDEQQQSGRYQICGAEDHLQRLEGGFQFLAD
ncbi:acyl dehydratase [Pseudidiomarina sp. GXY010]|uniref:Acyl dehydratase n=1 Tax=Pseudidiomarina fusca TaxID=2965078 RepID=A0ABU3KZB9_9GAMM|nr:MaoC/PaaZ C-terminal domain-containing protein [Pseudidiomarina sp. GXY010]MDT7526517.1 acyl dehydratase [Pseudidiomarina sp. GXY010]